MSYRFFDARLTQDDLDRLRQLYRAGRVQPGHLIALRARNPVRPETWRPPRPPTPPQPQRCVLCDTPLGVNDLVGHTPTRSCDHGFTVCSACLRAYAEEHRTHRPPLRCPDPGCTYFMVYADMRQILGEGYQMPSQDAEPATRVQPRRARSYGAPGEEGRRIVPERRASGSGAATATVLRASPPHTPQRALSRGPTPSPRIAPPGTSGETRRTPSTRSSGNVGVSTQDPPDTSSPAPLPRARSRTSTPSPRTPPTSPTRTCIICLDTLPLPSFPPAPPTSTCTHPTTTCAPCLTQHVRSRIASSARTIPCPSCPSILEFNDVRRSVPPADFDRYDALLLRQGLSSAREFVWCLNPACGAGQMHDGRAEGEVIVTCASCAAKSCFVHQTPWHSGLTCEAYDALLSRTRHTTDADRAYLRQYTKQCPRCGVAIQKTDGCDHMTCRPPGGCGHQFCWVCLADWGTIMREGNQRHRPECEFYRPFMPAGGGGGGGGERWWLEVQDWEAGRATPPPPPGRAIPLPMDVHFAPAHRRVPTPVHGILRVGRQGRDEGLGRVPRVVPVRPLMHMFEQDVEQGGIVPVDIQQWRQGVGV